MICFVEFDTIINVITYDKFYLILLCFENVCNCIELCHKVFRFRKFFIKKSFFILYTIHKPNPTHPINDESVLIVKMWVGG